MSSAHRSSLRWKKPSAGLVGLLLVGAAGCDQTNTTYDATYVVRSETGVIVSEGQGYGTLGSVLAFGKGADAVSLRSKKHDRRSASFEAMFGDDSSQTVVVPFGASQEITSKDGRITLQVRVDTP